jgi:hypothetical protein
MRRQIHVVIAVVLVAGMLAGALAQKPPKPKKLSEKEQAVVDAAALGTMENPVRCSTMEGAKAYIGRLRCPSGNAPKSEYNGNVGQGPYGTNMEYFLLSCKKDGSTANLFLDTHHKEFVEERAIAGFTIVKAKGKKGS